MSEELLVYDDVHKQLSRLRLLAEQTSGGFCLLLVEGHDVPAVRLDEGWHFADYDARLLAAILALFQPTATALGEMLALGFWEAIGPAELYPDNGCERIKNRDELTNQ